MKNVLMVLLSFLFLNSCVNRRTGKVKIINTGMVNRGDSIILLNPFYTYNTFANEITCCDWYKPSKKQLEIERQWDSIQYAVTKAFFAVDFVKYGSRNTVYNQRTFIFKFPWGHKEKTFSDSVSYIITHFAWNIRAGKMEEAIRYLSDSIRMLSYKQPIAIFTNRYKIFDIPFRAAYISGVTDLQFIPETFLIILKEGEIAYFRGYRKSMKYKKIENNPDFINKYTHKLFDKLQ